MKKINAIVYCDGAFNTPSGKTAHGLVRFTERYNVIAIIDSKYAGQDALMVLDHKPGNIPIVKNLEASVAYAKEKKIKHNNLVIGIATDGDR